MRQKVAMHEYATDYQVQRDLQKIFIDMRDAHTVYAPPRCYSSFFFYLPFPLDSRAEYDDHGQLEQVIRVGSFPKKYEEIALNYTTVYPQQKDVVSKYAGWKVVKIDQQDPVQYLVDYADEFVGYSHDSSVRFNYVIKQAWYARNLMRDLVPTSGNITFFLQHPQQANTTEEITVDIYGKNAYNVDSVWDLVNQCGYKVDHGNVSTTVTESANALKSVTQTWSHTIERVNSAVSSVWNLYTWYRYPYYQVTRSLADEWYAPVKKALQKTRILSSTAAPQHERTIFDTMLDIFPVLPQANVPSLTHKLIDYASHSPHFRKSRSFKRFAREQQLRRIQNVLLDEAPIGSTYENLYIAPGGEFAVAKKKGTDIGVLQVATFMPNIDIVDTKDSVESFLGQNPLKVFAKRMQNATRVLSENGIKKLVVDVRGNTGGVICYGWLLAYYLSPYAPRDPSPNSDIIYSDVQKDLNCPSNFINSLNQGMASSRKQLEEDWFTNGPVLERGGSSSKYTKKILLSCQLAMLITDVDYEYRPAIQYEPSDLVILTDGTCGSTCGMFVQLMQYLELAKIVAQGGIKGQEIAVASFKGAAVMVSNNFFSTQTVSLCPVQAENKVKKFPSNSLMTWAWLESYPWSPRIGAFELTKADTSIPMEFIREKPERRLWDWDFQQTETLYEKVIPHLDACAKWEVKKNSACKAPFEHAVSGNPCQFDETLGYGTSFDTTQCVLFQCESNYYLSENRSECLRMPDPFDSLSVVFYILTVVVAILSVIFIAVCLCCNACCICCTRCGTNLYTTKRSPLVQDQYLPQLDDHDIEMSAVTI